MSSSLKTEASWCDDLIPVKVAYFSVAWSGIHRKQGLLYTQTAVALSFLAVKACTAELASAGCTAAQRWPYEITQDAASLLHLSHETGTQKPLCALPLVSPPSAWLTKPGCLSPAHQPRALPDKHCLWKSLFSSLTVLSGAEAERGAVFFTTMWGKHAASCRSALASVLDSLFSVFLSFSPSSLGLSTSQISSVETLRVTPGTQSYSWNTQSAIQRCWVCWECTRLWCWVPCDRMDSWKRFRARQHCCPSCPSWTKDSLPLFWIFDKGSSGASENSDASKSHFEAVSWQKGKWSKENLANAVEKLDLTLTVFLMEVWISIRRQRQRWEKFIFTRGGC